MRYRKLHRFCKLAAAVCGAGIVYQSTCVPGITLPNPGTLDLNFLFAQAAIAISDTVFFFMNNWLVRLT